MWAVQERVDCVRVTVVGAADGIDDASHLVERSLSCLDRAFPALRTRLSVASGTTGPTTRLRPSTSAKAMADAGSNPPETIRARCTSLSMSASSIAKSIATREASLAGIPVGSAYTRRAVDRLKEVGVM